MYSTTKIRMLVVCISVRPNIQYRTFYTKIKMLVVCFLHTPTFIIEPEFFYQLTT